MGKKKELSIRTAKRNPDKGNEPKVVGSDKAIEETDPMDNFRRSAISIAATKKQMFLSLA